MSSILEIQEDDLKLFTPYSDYKFDLEHSMGHAKLILEELELTSIECDCNFDNDIWKIFISRQGSYKNIQFNSIRELLVFRKEIEGNVFLKIVKSWTAFLMERNKPDNVIDKFRCLKSLLTWTNCFLPTEDNINNLRDQLYKLSDGHCHLLCTVGMNFLDFCIEIDENMIYSKLLNEIKDTIPINKYRQQLVRELPSPKDILIFSNVLNDYFENIKIPSVDYFRYFPIYLWWNITSVIPIRPSELCTIRRDGFVDEKNGEFYLKLPRSSKGTTLNKSQNKNRIQIIDTIRIPSELGKMIQQYIKLTEPFGFTRTLLSYPAWELSGSKGKNNPKITRDWYSSRVLISHLQLFYKEVIEGIYGVTLRPNEETLHSTFKPDVKILASDKYDIDRILRPGDTRHLAFINLLRQGFHPIEIARLGGHTNINSQYHYHQHADKFVDTEVLKLLSKFKIHQQNSLNEKRITANSSFTDTEFRKKFVIKPISKEKIKKKLKDGFCSEPNQRCPVNDCLLCDFWGIEINEYNEKRDYIKARASEVYDDTKKIMAMIIDIHKYVIENLPLEPDTSEDSIALNRDLVTLSKQLDESLSKIAKLNTLEERVIPRYGH